MNKLMNKMWAMYWRTWQDTNQLKLSWDLIVFDLLLAPDCARIHCVACCFVCQWVLPLIQDFSQYQGSKDALAWFENDSTQSQVYCNAWESRENVVIQKDPFLTWCLPLILWQGKLKTLWVEGIYEITLWPTVFQAMKGSILCHQRQLDVE